MTLPEIDKSIAGWNSRMGAAAQNLMDLQSLPTYQRLAGTNGVPMAEVTGETAAVVKPALAGISRMLQCFDLLQRMVMRVEEIRRDMPMWSAEARIREIEQLLTTPSISMPVDPVPLDHRSLLSSGENTEKVAPAKLLHFIADTFDQAKNAILRVDAAWESLGRRIDEITAAIEELRPDADAAALSELEEASRAIEVAKTKAEADPLAAVNEFESAAGSIILRVRNRVAEVKQLRREIETGFAVCRAQMESLATLHQEAVALHGDASDKVSMPQPLPPPAQDAVIAGLRDWLERLQTKYREGVVQPIVTGIRNWNKAAEQCVSSERRVLLACRAPIEARAELRGRMDALRAKARARGVAEEDELCRLAEECRALLYTRPTDLARAGEAVGAYEKQLSAKA